MTEPDATMTMADITAEFDRLNSQWTALMARARAALARLEEPLGHETIARPTT